MTLSLNQILALEQRVINREFEHGPCCIDSNGAQIEPQHNQWFIEAESADSYEGETYINFGCFYRCFKDKYGDVAFITDGPDAVDANVNGHILVLQA